MRRQQQNVVEGQGGRAELLVAHLTFHVRVLETVSGFWIAFILVTGPARQAASVHLGDRRLGRGPGDGLRYPASATAMARSRASARCWATRTAPAVIPSAFPVSSADRPVSTRSTSNSR